MNINQTVLAKQISSLLAQFCYPIVWNIHYKTADDMMTQVLIIFSFSCSIKQAHQKVKFPENQSVFYDLPFQVIREKNLH